MLASAILMNPFPARCCLLLQVTSSVRQHVLASVILINPFPARCVALLLQVLHKRLTERFVLVQVLHKRLTERFVLSQVLDKKSHREIRTGASPS